MEDTLSKFMSESAKRHEENSNLIKEIRAMTDAAIRNQEASIKTLEIQIGKMSKVLQERGFESLPSSTETNSRDQVNLISTTIESNSHPIRPSVSVMPLLTYLNLGLGELAYTRLTVELADRTMKYPKGIAENIQVEIGKFTFPIDFIILDMPEDIKVPLILGRSFLSTAWDENLYTGIDDYPSYCDDDKKIHMDCAHNLRFSCMIGFEFTHANFFPLLYVNVISKKFHNSIMKDKMVYKGNNVVGAVTNVPIFVRTFSAVTDFAVLENMDAYRDEGMGDVIVGEPFLKEVRIKAKRFEGIIILYKMMMKQLTKWCDHI
ncbi:reverse transcriptase domain-containing protein [Tanacetum coccineum]